MKIGIDASRAFLKNRTGIEEYSYQVIKHLRGKLNKAEVILYLRPNKMFCKSCDFKIPKNWRIKIIRWPRLWTQFGLSLEMLVHPVDVLFIPAHTIPIINPNHFLVKIIRWLKKKKGKAKTIVTIHGLEYEFLPKAYSQWEKFYMSWSIRKSCRWATDIISVSENTKSDLMKLYNVPKKKIRVIYEGVGDIIKNVPSKINVSEDLQSIIDNHKYMLFIGRIEERKNIFGIIKAFEILKRKHSIPHKLILVGSFGYGYGSIISQIESSKYKNDIFLTGYIGGDKKQIILKKSKIFLFPTFYEGFGLPILEAQSMGIPVVASNKSAIPEIIGQYMKPMLVNPNNPREIAKIICRIISDKKLRNDIIRTGYKNIERFSWEGCAKSISVVIKK